MKTKQIIVEVAEDGSIKIDAHGFSGASCEKATKFLEDALGTAGGRTRKPEYTQDVRQVRTLRQ